MLLPPFLWARGIPELPAQPGSSSPAARHPRTCSRGSRGHRAHCLGCCVCPLLTLSSSSETGIIPQCSYGKGERNPFDQVGQSPPPPLAFPEFHSPQPGPCVLSSHCTPQISELWERLSSFSSVSSQFRRNPIITVPVSGMSQSRGSDQFAGRSPTSVPGPDRAHKTAVFLFFCHVEVGQRWSSCKMKHEL